MKTKKLLSIMLVLISVSLLAMEEEDNELKPKDITYCISISPIETLQNQLETLAEQVSELLNQETISDIAYDRFCKDADELIDQAELYENKDLVLEAKRLKGLIFLKKMGKSNTCNSIGLSNNKRKRNDKDDDNQRSQRNPRIVRRLTFSDSEEETAG